VNFEENEQENLKFKSKVADNAAELIGNLPQNNSHLKQPLLLFLASGLPTSFCSIFFSTTEATIKAAKSTRDNDLQTTLLFAKQLCGHRQKTSDFEIKLFKEFIENECKTPSGAKKDILVNQTPIGQLYENFLKFREEKNKEIGIQNFNTIQNESLGESEMRVLKIALSELK